MKYLGILLIAFLSMSAWTGNSFAYDGKKVVADTAGCVDSVKIKLANKIIEDSCERLVLIDSVIAYSKNFIGYHYKYGSNGQNKSFDCSHFVSACYKKYGVNIPCSSAGLYQLGNEISINEVRPGDLMFFKGRNASSSKVGHVSLVIENNNGHIKLIHATHRGVVIDELDEMEYYQQRFLIAKRLDLTR